MNRAPPRRSLRLCAKYKANLHIVRDLIEARLESDLDNPSGISREGTPELGESSQNNPITPTPNIGYRMEREDEDEFRPHTT